MKKLLIAIMIIVGNLSFAQMQTIKPKVMVIPFTKDGEDIRTVLDNDVNRRIAITKVKEGFDNKGYVTVDFVGKLKAARDNQVFTSDNQTDIKSKIIEMSGCDIYVIVEVDQKKDNTSSSVNINLSSYEVSTGNSLSNKVANSGKFDTDDYGRLTAKAVEKCIDDFVTTMLNRLELLHKEGRSVIVDFSFGENAELNMTSEVGSDKLALSDNLEDWISKNSFNGNYHIQGTTSLKMIFDDVKIPIKDKNGATVTTNKFALELFKYLKSLGLNPTKDIKSNTIYITIN